MQIWWQFGRAIDFETRHNMPLDHFLTSTAHQSLALPCPIICLLFFFSTIPGQHSLLCPPPHCLLLWNILPIICLVDNTFLQLFFQLFAWLARLIQLFHYLVLFQFICQLFALLATSSSNSLPHPHHLHHLLLTTFIQLFHSSTTLQLFALETTLLPIFFQFCLVGRTRIDQLVDGAQFRRLSWRWQR